MTSCPGSYSYSSNHTLVKITRSYKKKSENQIKEDNQLQASHTMLKSNLWLYFMCLTYTELEVNMKDII